MIKKLTLELEVFPIDQLVLTDKPQEIWASNLTRSCSNWDRISVWHQTRWAIEGGRVWSYGSSSDVKYNNYTPIPFTHYTILPHIQIPAT